jgi:hypothetical protein
MAVALRIDLLNLAGPWSGGTLLHGEVLCVANARERLRLKLVQRWGVSGRGNPLSVEVASWVFAEVDLEAGKRERLAFTVRVPEGPPSMSAELFEVLHELSVTAGNAKAVYRFDVCASEEACLKVRADFEGARAEAKWQQTPAIVRAITWLIFSPLMALAAVPALFALAEKARHRRHQE